MLVICHGDYVTEKSKPCNCYKYYILEYLDNLLALWEGFN